MGFLLSEWDGRLLGPDADLEPRAHRADGQVPVAQAPDQVERRPRRLRLSEPQGVRRHSGFDGRPDLGGRTEEAVCRGESFQGLVRPLEVVVLDEQGDPPSAVVEVGEHRAREELLPQGLPEALDLAAGLRVVRAALHMLDALAPEFLLEPRHAPPSGVLPALVGEDLPRCAVVGDTPGQGLHHEFAPLVVGHDEAHEVAGVVV